MPPTGNDDYDAEDFFRVVAVLVDMNPGASLPQVWSLIDWPTIRYHRESYFDHIARLDKLREERRG